MRRTFLIVLACAIAIAANAQDTRTVTVTGFTGHPQLKNEWCWAACIQSMLEARGITIGQSAIVEAAYGRDVNQPAPGFEGTVELLNRLTLNVGGEVWKVSAYARPRHPDPKWLFEELSNNDPVMIWFRAKDLDHAIVLTGGVSLVDRLGKFVGWRSLTAYDPLLNRIMPIPGINIPRYVYGTFTIRVTKLPR